MKILISKKTIIDIHDTKTTKEEILTIKLELPTTLKTATAWITNLLNKLVNHFNSNVIQNNPININAPLFPFNETTKTNFKKIKK